MTITPNSPIDTLYSGALYLSNNYFTPKLFFTDSAIKMSYMILREENTQTKVITSGVLQGHPNGVDYDYRFDFTNYIKIDNQGTPQVTGDVDGTNYQFSGNNTCKLYFVYSITDFDLVNTNIIAWNLSLLTNGEVILATGKTVDLLIATGYGEFRFIDRSADVDFINIGTNKKAFFNQYLPITSYTEELKIRVQTISTVYYVSVIKADADDYKVCLLWVPFDCQNIVIQYKAVNSYRDFYLLKPEKICAVPYYFFNKNGMFDALYCEGKDNEINTVKRETLQVGNKKIQTSITINKQLKQNTGLKLTQDQIYSLMGSPLVYVIYYGYGDLILDEGGVPIRDENHNYVKLEGGLSFKEYMIDLESFEGYNGKKISERNLELTFTDPKQYKRYTNANITFFD